MKILIVSATFNETQNLIQILSFNRNINSKLSSYNYISVSIDILITGVGMASAAYWLGKTLSDNKYDYALNLGIAGSFNKSINLGSVVNVKSDCFSELGAENNENFIPINKLNLLTKNDLLENLYLDNHYTINNAIINNLKEVKGITVNTIHGNEENIEKTRKLYNPDIETMEGASFLYARLTEKIPNAQIRAISNYVEKRNKNNWEIDIAIENLNKTAIDIIKSL